VNQNFNDQPNPEVVRGERAYVDLSNFLSNSSAARAAATSLRRGAEVAIIFTHVPGEWRICVNDATGVSLEPGKATDPDFELRVPPGAVRSICSRHDADVGDLGVTFLEHIAVHDPELKIQVTLHSGLLKLTSRGWLGVLARGGPKVVVWMTKKGLRGRGAIATVIGRLKG
jgi:hypothetical protein